MMMRRQVLLTGGAFLGAAVVGLRPAGAAQEVFEITRSEAEWRAMLTPLQYKVMRKEGTERTGGYGRRSTKFMTRAAIIAGGATCRSIRRATNTIAAPVGRVSGRRCRMRLARGRIANCSMCAPNAIVAAVAVTLDISLMTGQNRRARGTVSMG